jgi:hypothetical protein
MVMILVMNEKECNDFATFAALTLHPDKLIEMLKDHEGFAVPWQIKKC